MGLFNQFKWLRNSLMLLVMVGSAPANAWFENIDVTFGGFVRAEAAYRTTGEENPNNQLGNTFNNQTVARTAYLPPALTVGLNQNIVQGILPNELLSLVDSIVPVPGLSLGDVGKWGSVPLILFDDTIRRGDFVGANADNDFNYTVLRTEIEMGMRFTRNWRFVARVRGVFDPTIYDEYDANVSKGFQGGLRAGNADPNLYEGQPNYFDYEVSGNGQRHNPLEWTGRDYQVYFPAMLMEYNSGGLSVRVGNQQIAWGQSIFFRVFDLPNGLDLRRHLILDRALEEFSDKRVPMLSARVTYQMTDNILADGYVGKFQPTVFGNPNTPYNIIPTQFTVVDSYESGGFDDELSYGFRLKGDYGQFGWQAAAVRRFSPEGTFRWTKSGVDTPLSGALGNLVNTLYSLKQPEGSLTCPIYDAALCSRYSDTGEALANSPFAAIPGGVYSAEEWFKYAADVRLDGIMGLNAAIEDFSALQDIYVTQVENYEQAYAELDTLFIASGGGYRGFIERTYHQENIFALGGSYVNEAENDFLNQLIFNLEVQYAPDRNFTNITLGQKPITEDEYTVSLVVDKWHRFFDSFPGTYIVFQALTKNKSDLVGRHLSGYGGKQTKDLKPGDTRQTVPKTDNANYLVFGFLQPFPNKIWEIEFATLFDPEGGILAQPGVRWNPGSGVTVEGFYNYINGDLYGNPNDNLISTLNFANEVTIRATYQF